MLKAVPAWPWETARAGDSMNDPMLKLQKVSYLLSALERNELLICNCSFPVSAFFIDSHALNIPCLKVGNILS